MWTGFNWQTAVNAVINTEFHRRWAIY